MKMIWRKVLIFGGVGIVLTGCSLLLGPLSKLSFESIINRPWQWTWFGEWTGSENAIDFAQPRYLSVYRLVDQKDPGFFAYVHNNPGGYLYIHFSPSKERKEVQRGFTGYFYFPRVYVTEDQKGFLFQALSLADSRVLWYDGKTTTTSGESFPYLHSLTSLGEKVLVSFIDGYSAYTNRISLLSPGSSSTSFYIFPESSSSHNMYLFTLEGDTPESSLIVAVTNQSYSSCLTFLDSHGGFQGEKSTNFSNDGGGAPLAGVVVGSTPYLLANSYNSYTLFRWQSGGWQGIETRVIVGAYTTIKAIDMVAVDDVFWAAWVVEPNKIHVGCYRHFAEGAKLLTERDLTVPSEKGSIEGIDFFYDRAGGRVILGVLHAVPPDNHIGISYWSIPAW